MRLLNRKPSRTQPLRITTISLDGKHDRPVAVYDGDVYRIVDPSGHTFVEITYHGNDMQVRLLAPFLIPDRATASWLKASLP